MKHKLVKKKDFEKQYKSKEETFRAFSDFLDSNAKSEKDCFLNENSNTIGKLGEKN